jgi:predicted nucleotidyltransferase component of viral defense system
MLHKETVEPSTLELLVKLQQKDYLNNFFLVGGTALALHIGHRKSIDLDFFSTENYDTSHLLENLSTDFPFQLLLSSKNSITGSINQIKTDFISHRYPLIKEPLQKENTRIASIEDIIAMKLNAITVSGQRVKDFIDIYYLLDKYSIGEMKSFYSYKYNNYNDINMLKSLIWFNDVDLSDWPELIKHPELKWEDVKSKILQDTNQYLQSI